MKSHKALKRTFIVILIMIAVLVVGFLVYASFYYSPDRAMIEKVDIPNSQITETDDYIIYGEPENAVTGYIFYPGAKVDARSYATYLYGISRETDITCAVVKPPFHLAIFSPNAAREIIEKYSSIDSWYVGGHSLGGVVASDFADDNRSEVDGLILLASYPNGDLSQAPVNVLSITASNDEVLSWESFEESKGDLPPDTHFTMIEGGNHAQFGCYGVQKGDGIAAIKPKEQIDEAIALTSQFILAS